MNTILEFIKHRMITSIILIFMAVTGIQFETSPWVDLLLMALLLAAVLIVINLRVRK